MRRLIILCLFTTGWTAYADAAEKLTLPVARRFARAVVVGESIYLFGGGVKHVDVLDTKRQTWSQLTPEVDASLGLYGDIIDGRLYLLDTTTGKLVRYDPETKRSEPLQYLSTRRINGTVIAAGDKLYVIGGYHPSVTKKNCVEVYDPKTNRWTTGPPLPVYAALDHFHGAAVLGGKLHVIGGLIEAKGQPHWRLDGDRWVARAEPPLQVMWKHTALAVVGGKLYHIAPHPATVDNRHSDARQNVHCYDPATDRWQAVGQTPEEFPIGLFAPAAVGAKVYILGGLGSRSVHIYDTSTGEWK